MLFWLVRLARLRNSLARLASWRGWKLFFLEKIADRERFTLCSKLCACSSMFNFLLRSPRRRISSSKPGKFIGTVCPNKVTELTAVNLVWVHVEEAGQSVRPSWDFVVTFYSEL